jgi:hypothetical protein
MQYTRSGGSGLAAMPCRFPSICPLVRCDSSDRVVICSFHLPFLLKRSAPFPSRHVLPEHLIPASPSRDRRPRSIRGWTWSVTVCAGKQVVLHPQLASAAPAAQSINASSADFGPSLADQLSARADCHQHPQHKGGSPGDFHRRQLPHHEAFSPLARAYIPGSDTGTAEQTAPSSSPKCVSDLAAAFPQSAVRPERQPGRSRPRHREAFCPLVESEYSSPCSWGSLTEQSSGGA